ncbi:Golgin imh1 [Paecilomyces lecythidis]|uniref:Golgin imh1 n=1 Tax=Paecilomyces lecythidis TaxID=3004212 RepID=A0ABR3WUN1_9EURO
MFQRIRGAIDSRIAEEQARQRQAQESISRSNSARRQTSRDLSTSRRPGRTRAGTLSGKGPDPAEFESEFAVGEDDGSSRSATPRSEPSAPPEGGASGDGEKKASPESAGKEAASDTGSNTAAAELPTDVRVRLRRLDKLESRYQDLLRAYRVAHARVLSIEPFEAALRENTPLTSISDPKAFTEYLNQISLKGDMVLDELKRVTAERDQFKKNLEEAEKSTKAAWDEVTNLKKGQAEGNQSSESGTTNGAADKLTIDTTPSTDAENSQKSPTGSITSKATTIPGMSLFSPRMKASKSPPPKEESEEFFSFDTEIPRLESELKEKKDQIEGLQSQVENLKRDLSVARESTEGMVGSLESATRELEGLRDAKDGYEAEIARLKDSSRAEVHELKIKISTAESALEKAQAAAEDLKTQLKEKSEECEKLKQQIPDANTPDQADLSKKLAETEKEKEESKKRLDVLQGLVDSLKSQLKESESSLSTVNVELSEKGNLQKIVDFIDTGLKDNEKWPAVRKRVASGQEADFAEIQADLAPASSGTAEPAKPKQDQAPQPATGAGSGGGKKKKNKKKKGGKGGDETSAAANAAVSSEKQQPGADDSKEETDISELELKIESLNSQLAEKDAAIDRLHLKLKGEEDLKEEIESLRDDLLHLGQDHVEAKDKIKELTAEKAALEASLAKLEKELTELQTSNASSTAGSEKAHNDLKVEFEELKVKATTLETDLSAAQQLAASRFKDLTDLRETLQKLQPELRTLRSESAELKTTKEDLKNKSAELKNLQAKHDELRTEAKNLRSSIAERDTEVRTLNQKIRQETDSRLKAEEACATAKSDLRTMEAKKQEATEAKEKAKKELSKTQDELKAARAKLREVEEQVPQLNKDIEGLREEIQLKTAQHASAQSLMNSMRDQSAEMAMQMKEVRQRCESLEEELVDAHRLLSERSREGETMRRLLSDIESKADAKVRDFKERMEAAIEERDRAEDEASTVGRRRARELEELKAKVRETEKALRRAEEDKEELEHAQKDWRRRRDELVSQSERSVQELQEVREAMAELRDALDESEKQVRELEKEKAELRRSVEETSSRLDKVRKSHKLLTDEVRSAQTSTRGLDSNTQSSRSSIDSGSRKGVVSPPPRDRNLSVSRSQTPTGPAAPAIDYIYLKNVLLQFLEQKDKNYQKQLIPVLGMLLHFDRSDEQKWMTAVMSR